MNDRALETAASPRIATRVRRVAQIVVVLLPVVLRAESNESAATMTHTGAAIYRAQCAKCHGPQGEGGTEDYDEPLYGERSIEALARFIAKKMPKDEPGSCTGDDAQRVARYIYDAFYSSNARNRHSPERVQLSHLTARQYATTVADLVASFRPTAKPTVEEHGLTGQYFASSEFARNKKVFERRDPWIEFRFETNEADAKRLGSEYTIRWTGSVIADETGDYEFGVTTESAVRMWLNDDTQLAIDAWVSGGAEAREHKHTVFLLGGRAYPLRIEFFKSNQKNGELALRWKAPHRTWETIPPENLVVSRVPPTLIVTTRFPPDDSSAGYERGTAISREWVDAASAAAVEVADKVVSQSEMFSGVPLNAVDAHRRLQPFCVQFAAHAFRRPLSHDEEQRFVGKPFATANDAATALKRSLLLVLQSPRFLYPDLASAGTLDDYDVAARLALALWDSLPDDELIRVAEQGRLHTSPQVATQARRMLRDPRAREKMREFFHQWLKVEKADDIAKDPIAYPEFDAEVLADLRQSLDLFLAEVMWSDRSDYRQFLLADYLYLNERLGKIYGTPVRRGGFRKVVIDGQPRAGVITHPYLLTAFAYHNNSSPIHRGVFLTRNILGRTIKPPPKAVAFKETDFDPNLSLREKIAKLTQATACQGCHRTINPLGFSLENYDGVGRYRTVENRKPVNAASDYETSDDNIVHFDGPRDVALYAANSPEAQRGFVQQLFHAIVKQPVGAYGAGTLEDLCRTFVASDYNMQSLLMEIAKIAALAGTDEADGRATHAPSVPDVSAAVVVAGTPASN